VLLWHRVPLGLPRHVARAARAAHISCIYVSTRTEPRYPPSAAQQHGPALHPRLHFCQPRPSLNFPPVLTVHVSAARIPPQHDEKEDERLCLEPSFEAVYITLPFARRKFVRVPRLLRQLAAVLVQKQASPSDAGSRCAQASTIYGPWHGVIVNLQVAVVESCPACLHAGDALRSGLPSERMLPINQPPARGGPFSSTQGARGRPYLLPLRRSRCHLLPCACSFGRGYLAVLQAL